MQIDKIHKPGFCVAGIKVDTNSANEANPESALIPALWQQFFSENIESQIPDQTGETSVLGVYWNYEGDSEKSYSLLVGREVSSLNPVSGGLTALEIPDSDYLVFSDEGEMPEIIYSMWHYIWDYFSNTDRYQRQYSYDFECYSNDNDAKVDIYIAIKP